MVDHPASKIKHPHTGIVVTHPAWWSGGRVRVTVHPTTTHAMQNILDDVPTDALYEEIIRREVSSPGYELVVDNRGEYQLRICINSDGELVIQSGVNTTVLYSDDLQRLRMMLNANA